MTPKRDSVPGSGANPFLTYERMHHAHVVADIHFSKTVPVDDSPVICACSWSGMVGEWPAHAPGNRLSVQHAWNEEGWNGPRHNIPHTRIPAI